MAVCSYCKRRKAKRHCPARREELCQLCCGELREKKINCPPSCPHLKHQSYQEEKRWQKIREFPPSFDEKRIAYLATQVEASLLYLAEQDKSLNDRDVLRGLDYAREKIIAGGGRLILPGENPGPKPALGEALFQVINNTRYEKGLILQLSEQEYTQEEKIICIDAMVRFILEKTRGDLDDRRYLEDLVARHQKAKNQPAPKIILP